MAEKIARLTSCGSAVFVHTLLFLFFILALINLIGKRESSAKFEPSVLPYNNENAQFAPLLVLDCRGLEFTGFDPRVMGSSP